MSVSMCIALFIIDKKQKQLKHPLSQEYVSKMLSIHTMGYDLAIKGNEVIDSLQHGSTLKTCSKRRKNHTEEEVWCDSICALCPE